MKTFAVMVFVEGDSLEDARQLAICGAGRLQPEIPLPYSEWPTWAKALRQFSTPDDKGIGDVVLRIIGDENSEAFKAWFQKIFNRPCNCDGRLRQWNSIYPLKEI